GAGPVKTFKACSSAIRNHVSLGSRAHLTMVIAAKCDALRFRLSWEVDARLIALDVGPEELAVLHTIGMARKADTSVMHDSRHSGTNLDACDPRVFLERVRQHHDHVLHPALCRHVEWRRLDHNVR